MPLAIVTGGGGALGKGISLGLALRGWRIAIVDLVEEFALETAAEIGPAAAPLVKILDVGDLAAVRRAFAEIHEETGRIDALVNAAGGALALRVEKGPVVRNRPIDWDKMLGVNIYGTLNCCHSVASYMKAAKAGGIVSLASGAGFRGGPPVSRQSDAAVYSATKAGVIGFTQALAQELGPHGVRVNAVAPGRNQSRDKPLTKMLEMQAEEETALPGSGRKSPLIRLGQPRDIADAVAFLLSKEASYITGCCLDLTGGIRMH